MCVCAHVLVLLVFIANVLVYFDVLHLGHGFIGTLQIFSQGSGTALKHRFNLDLPLFHVLAFCLPLCPLSHTHAHTHSVFCLLDVTEKLHKMEPVLYRRETNDCFDVSCPMYCLYRIQNIFLAMRNLVWVYTEKCITISQQLQKQWLLNAWTCVKPRTTVSTLAFISEFSSSCCRNLSDAVMWQLPQHQAALNNRLTARNTQRILVGKGFPNYCQIAWD